MVLGHGVAQGQDAGAVLFVYSGVAARWIAISHGLGVADERVLAHRFLPPHGEVPRAARHGVGERLPRRFHVHAWTVDPPR